MSLLLDKNNIAAKLSIDPDMLEPFNLNLKKVMLILDEYTNCFPSLTEYNAISDEHIKELYFTAIILQWEYMINNSEMYNPSEVLIGESVGRHSYSGISAEALQSFSRYEPTAINMLERNGLTCNGIRICDQ